MNQSSLRNIWSNSKTSGKLPISLEEIVEPTSNQWIKTERCQDVNPFWRRKHSDLNRLCPQISSTKCDTLGTVIYKPLTWTLKTTLDCLDGLVAAELFGVPTPTPWEHLDANNTNNGGVNFGVGGAGVTYAFGYRALDAQVDAFSELVDGGCWTKEHLRKSVALVSIGINDYTSFNRHGDPSVRKHEPISHHES